MKCARASHDTEKMSKTRNLVFCSVYKTNVKPVRSICVNYSMAACLHVTVFIFFCAVGALCMFSYF